MSSHNLSQEDLDPDTFHLLNSTETLLELCKDTLEDVHRAELLKQQQGKASDVIDTIWENLDALPEAVGALKRKLKKLGYVSVVSLIHAQFFLFFETGSLSKANKYRCRGNCEFTTTLYSSYLTYLKIHTFLSLAAKYSQLALLKIPSSKMWKLRSLWKVSLDLKSRRLLCLAGFCDALTGLTFTVDELMLIQMEFCPNLPTDLIQDERD
jgi:hypothetical protein